MNASQRAYEELSIIFRWNDLTEILQALADLCEEKGLLDESQIIADAKEEIETL